jgi:hypothetical protein
VPDSITQAQPPLEFIPPAFNPLVRHVTRAFLPLWMRWRIKLVDVQVINADRLVELYQQFQAGKVRFLMAFRHPSVNDPFSMYYMVSHRIPQVAWQKGIRLNSPVHAYFIYDRGIPLWAGNLVGWLLPRLGGTSIRRGKLDLPGLRSARELFANGRFPMAAAPEGATNGHTEIVSPIEPGIAQFGFWCVEDLLKANRTEEVLLLPIGIQYRYVSAPWAALDKLLLQLEADCGLPPYNPQTAQPQNGAVPLAEIPLTDQQQILLYKRLLRLGDYLLSQMEQFYTKFYHQDLKLKTTKPITEAETGSTLCNEAIATRLQALMNAALTVAEDYFGVPAKGSFTDRCRRLEQAGWEWIYREDLGNVEQLSPVERGLADRIAEEANLRLWHMRLVETFVSVTGRYILEKPTVDRFAETLFLLWDTVTRLKGANPFRRPILGKQRVEITIGQPISVSSRWDDYKASRRQAIATLTQDLQTALEKMIL